MGGERSHEDLYFVESITGVGRDAAQQCAQSAGWGWQRRGGRAVTWFVLRHA